MEFSVQVDGLDRIDRAAQRVRDAVAKELARGMFASAKKVEAEAKKSILSGEKSGRVYRRRTVAHRASAPGEAPASDTGRLVNSITGTYEPSETAGVIRAGSGIVKYARMLEFGTSRMAARPFFFPAFERSKNWIRERLNKAVRTAVTHAVRR
jgi:HK97 gp10 family phage protein